MNLVRRTSSQLPILSKEGLFTFPPIQDEDLSIWGEPSKRSASCFNPSINAGVKYGEGRLKAAVIASQYLDVNIITIFLRSRQRAYLVAL